MLLIVDVMLSTVVLLKQICNSGWGKKINTITSQSQPTLIRNCENTGMEGVWTTDDRISTDHRASENGNLLKTEKNKHFQTD